MDVDVTLDGVKLKELATELGEPVYVLYEQDGRFENEASPRLDKARAIATSDAVEIRERVY